MNKEFTPKKQAIALKEIGFDEPCLAGYNFKDRRTGQFTYPSAKEPNTTSKARVYHKDKKIVGAPTYSQAFRWFRDKHQLYSEILLDQTTEPKFCFGISKFIGNPNDLSEREWDWENIPNDDNWGLYRKHEEAELACLNKLIEIVKKQK